MWSYNCKCFPCPSRFIERVWRYYRGNQKPYFEGQTTQWRKEKGQNTTQKKTKDRATRTPLNTGGELMCSKGYHFLLHLWHPSCNCYTIWKSCWTTVYVNNIYFICQINAVQITIIYLRKWHQYSDYLIFVMQMYLSIHNEFQLKPQNNEFQLKPQNNYFLVYIRNFIIMYSVTVYL